VLLLKLLTRLVILLLRKDELSVCVPLVFEAIQSVSLGIITGVLFKLRDSVLSFKSCGFIPCCGGILFYWAIC
jgi:hypothetical protein